MYASLRGSGIGIQRMLRVLLIAFLVPLYLNQIHAQAAAAANPKQTNSSSGSSQINQKTAETRSPASEEKIEDVALTQEMSEEQIASDTRKLHEMAIELRTEVGRTYKQSLSVGVLKKAAEIEKLAKSLKERMNKEAVAEKR